jgi:hypothetical protein
MPNVKFKVAQRFDSRRSSFLGSVSRIYWNYRYACLAKLPWRCTMTVARSKIVDPSITPWYHCISQCAQGLPLLKPKNQFNPQQWTQQRLEELVGIFAINVAGFSVMETHLHVLVHLDVDRSRNWSAEETITRWATLYPPRDACGNPLLDIGSWIQQMILDDQFVNKCRERLADLGWFMKSLKEPLSHLINAAGDNSGTCWMARYKSIAVLDERALLATCIYIDLNPFAAGLGNRPEDSMFTSLFLRIDACRMAGRLEDLKAARVSAAMGVLKSQDLEAGLWLCPIEDRMAQGSPRVGLAEGFSLGSYLLLLDATSRLLRPGKAHLSAEAEEILDRLGTSGKIWQETITALFSRPNPLGVTFSFDRSKLKAAAAARGVHHVANLNGCPAKPNSTRKPSK